MKRKRNQKNEFTSLPEVQINLDMLKALQDEFARVKSGKVTLGDDEFFDSSISYYLYRYALYLSHYDQKPQVVKDEKPVKKRTIPQENPYPTIYRGMFDFEHLKELVCDEDYHLGRGLAGPGFYFSSNYSTAKLYSKSEENVLTARLDPSTKIIDNEMLEDIKHYLAWLSWDNKRKRYIATYSPSDPFAQHICQKLKSALNEIRTDKTGDFISFLSFNNSILAIILGYDATMTTQETIVVHNRGKLILSESEYMRITGSYLSQEKADE